MKNEEKAQKISEDFYMPDTGFNREDLYESAIEMAEWKDSQYAEEKKELVGLVNMLPINENNQTIIEDLKSILS